MLSGSGDIGDTATLTCDAGFRVSSAALADSAITCESDGSWSHAAATCEQGKFKISESNCIKCIIREFVYSSQSGLTLQVFPLETIAPPSLSGKN